MTPPSTAHPRRRARRGAGGATLLAATALAATTAVALGAVAAAVPAAPIVSVGDLPFAAARRRRSGGGGGRRSSGGTSSRGRTGRRVAGAAAAAAAAAAARRRRRRRFGDDDEPLETEEPDFFFEDSDDEDDRGGLCFPAAATLAVYGVDAPSGGDGGTAAPRAVAMADVRLGDTVAGAAAGGGPEPLVLFSHRSPGGVHPFVALATAAGPVLTATAGHLVPVWSAAAGPTGVLTPVADVRLGDCLGVAASWPAAAERAVCVDAAGVVCGERGAAAAAANGSTATPPLAACAGLDAGGQRLSPVVAVTRRTAAGLYAPHTPSGTLVVDGVVASAYTTAVPVRLARAGVAVAAAAARAGLLTEASGGHLFVDGYGRGAGGALAHGVVGVATAAWRLTEGMTWSGLAY